MAVKYQIVVQDDGSATIKKFSKNVADTDKSQQKVAKGAKKLDASWAKAAKTAAVLAGGVVALRAGYRMLSTFVQRSIKESNIAAVTNAKLTASLRTLGQYSKENVDAITAQVTALQRVTVVGDDTAKEWIALGLSMGLPIEKTNEFAEAIAGAEAAGIPAQTMLRGLASSISGSAGQLSRYVPAVRDLTEAQLRAGEAINLVKDQFLSLAEAQRTTAAGAWQAMENAAGDYMEVIGGIITENKTVRATIIEVGDAILTAAGDAEDGAEALSSSVTDMVYTALDVFEFATKAAIRMRQLFQGANVVAATAEVAFYSVGIAVQRFAEGLLVSSAAIMEFLKPKKYAGITDAIRKDLEDTTTQMETLFNESTDNLNQQVAAWGQYGITIDEVTQKQDDLRASIASTAAALGEQAPPNVAAGAQATAQGAGGAGADADFTFDTGTVIDLTAKEEAESASLAHTAEVTSEMVTLYSGVTDSVMTFVDAVVQGQTAQEALRNGMMAFGKTVVSTILQMALKAIATRVSMAATNVASSAAEAAAGTPAAIVQSLATGGASATAGSTAMGIAIPAMTSLIGGIGDQGIMPGMLPGGGRQTVMIKNNETVVNSQGSKPLTRMLEWFEGSVVPDAGGAATRLGFGGGGPQSLAASVNLQIGDWQIRQMVNTVIEDGSDFGTGPVSSEAIR